MSWSTELILLGGMFLTLMGAGLWIPFAIGTTAVIYIHVTMGWGGLKGLGLISWGSTNTFTLTAIPLFLFMAEVLMQSGIGQRVYRGLAYLVVKLPGGLLQTNIVGCAVFSAISGSSVATAAAIGTVAMPQLMERRYNRRLATGSLAAGGTLGILIPPSVAMIIYGGFTDVSVARLFMAGIVPGIILASLFMLYIALRSVRERRTFQGNGEALQMNPSSGFLDAVSDVGPFVVLILLVLSSLYLGWATPTEAAAVGSVLAIVIAWGWGDLDLPKLRLSLQNTVRTASAIMFIVLAAFIFSYAVGFSGLPHSIADWLVGLGLGPLEFLLLVVALYIIMGCLVDSIGMMVITLPLIFPMLQTYGIDPLWFGVILVLLIELGLITPPLGINLFVIQSISPGCQLGDVVRGAAPFFFLIVGLVAILTVFPGLVLWLPAQM